jgi:hypothetical protein
MKKIILIVGIVNITILLSINMLSLFNQNKLNLYDLAWFDGFDITNLFPSNITGNLIIFGSVLGIVFINSFFYKIIKNKLL